MSDKEKGSFVHEITDFYKQSKNFIINCQKPDKKGKQKTFIIIKLILEFIKIAKQCSIGFLIMGAIGFVIKLIFLMINNILLS